MLDAAGGRVVKGNVTEVMTPGDTAREMPEAPAFPQWAWVTCWSLFGSNTVMIVASLLVRVDKGSTGWLQNLLAIGFPVSIGLSVLVAWRLTYVSMTSFGERVEALKENVERSTKKTSSTENARIEAKGFAITLKDGDVEASVVESSRHTSPARYTEFPFDMHFTLRRFYELLEEERAAVRAKAGRLAGIVGGSAVAAILAWGRI